MSPLAARPPPSEGRAGGREERLPENVPRQPGRPVRGGLINLGRRFPADSCPGSNWWLGVGGEMGRGECAHPVPPPRASWCAWGGGGVKGGFATPARLHSGLTEGPLGAGGQGRRGGISSTLAPAHVSSQSPPSGPVSLLPDSQASHVSFLQVGKLRPKLVVSQEGKLARKKDLVGHFLPPHLWGIYGAGP